MRLTRKGLRATRVFEPKPSKLADEDVYRWADEGTDIMAKIEPFTLTNRTNTQTFASLYGERITSMRAMYYTGATVLRVGMGVCADVPVEDACDYRIVGVFPWMTHQLAALEYIPESRRG